MQPLGPRSELVQAREWGLAWAQASPCTARERAQKAMADAGRKGRGHNVVVTEVSQSAGEHGPDAQDVDHTVVGGIPDIAVDGGEEGGDDGVQGIHRHLSYLVLCRRRSSSFFFENSVVEACLITCCKLKMIVNL